MPARAEHSLPANDTGADLGNVVPFMRPRGNARTAPAVVLPADAARPGAGGLTRERLRLAAFVTASLALHAGLFMAFWREPAPLASIGMEVISVEIVVGATAPAGVAPTQGEQQVNSAAAPETEETEVDKAEREGDRAAADRRGRARRNCARAEDRAAEGRRGKTRRAEEIRDRRRATGARAGGAEAGGRDGGNARARHCDREAAGNTASATLEVTLLPQPEEKPVEKKAEPKPVQAAPPKPVKDAKPAKEPRRIAAPTRETPAREAKASNPSTAANNVGVGRSDRDTNYPGLVSAHLRRHQQYPSDARSRGDQGTATVSFGLDGGGRVTSARLVRGSGVASIDQEVQAMVRRASPFPAPPDGRPRSFTVPVAFRLN